MKLGLKNIVQIPGASVSFDYELKNEDSDDIVLLEDDQLDLDGLITDVFLLSLDTKNLCKEDCRGLCPGCGADLNSEPCRCSKQVDPRLAGLAKFFEK